MIILIAHGSRDEKWRQSLEELAERVQEGDSAGEVRLAFMQFSGPTLPEVVEEGWSRGVREFRLLPLFMATAGHVDKDIRPMVRELAEGRLELLTPVGENRLFQELVKKIANDDRS
jgi:sirohydrochlorin cobaltochelatase